MKRTATEAFATAVPASGVFQPSTNAMLDPKAYFAQFQQAATTGQSLAPPGTPTFLAKSAAAVEAKSEFQEQVETASAVRCAAIVKEKGANFTTQVAIQALSTMATKSSYKLREELLRQPHVKKLCERVRTLLAAPPSGLSLELLSRAAWCLVRFPDEVLGTATLTLGPLTRMLESSDISCHADTASRILHCLTKAGIIQPQKHVVTKVVKELVRDVGRKVAELSHEGLVNMLTSIAASRVHKTARAGENESVRCEANDELFFSYASARFIAEHETMDARLLAEVPHVHAMTGIRDEKLFKAICPRIMAKQKELDEKTMGRCIKAYARFMIPLREEAQGFRTMAVVAKGDFIRPSDKPARQGPKKYDHPIALYEKPQLHSIG
jgi:hypothetical protein